MFRQFEFHHLEENSPYNSVHPFTKSIIISFFTIILILTKNITPLVFLNVLTLLLLFLSKFSPKKLWFIFVTLFFSTYGITLSQGLFYNIEPLTTWVDIGTISISPKISIPIKISYEGLAHGLFTSLRIIPTIILSYLTFFTTSPASLLKGFRQIGINFKVNIMLTSSIRFIPMILNDYKTIRRYQTLIGYSPSLRNPFQTIKHELLMIKPLFFFSLRQSTEIAYAILGRSFLNQKKEKSFWRFLPLTEKIILIFCFLYLVLLCLTKLFFFLYINNLVAITEFRFLYHISRYYL